MGWENPQTTPGNLVEFALHGGNQFVFVFVENGTPIFFRFEVDEVFGIEEAGSVSAVIGASHLTGALRNFGKRAQDDARLVHDADAFVGPSTRSKCAANPECAFIEVRQELGSDRTAEREENFPAGLRPRRCRR